MRERYGDDPSTHPNFDPDLWMEVGSSGGPDKNWVYGLSKTTAKNLRLLVVSQPLGALNQYRAPNLRISWPWNNTRLISPRNTSNSRRIMNSFAKWSWTWPHRVVIHVRPLFGRITTSLLLLLQLRHCANLIFFFETLSICNEYYLTSFFLFLIFNKILFA